MSEEDIQDRALRREKRLNGRARRGEREVEPAVFENVSDAGCCILGDYKIGEWLIVMIPTIGTMAAQVRWAVGGRAGLRFDRPRAADC